MRQAAPRATHGFLRRHPRNLAAATLTALTLAVYANSFPGNFFLDDVAIVRDNPLVSAPDLRRIFSGDYWGPEASSGLYRPLTILSYGLNRALLGPGAAGFHAVNVLLHAGNAALLFALLEGIGVTAAVAWAASACFALHPVNTEAVNLVVGRAELLAAFFVLLGLLAAAGRRRGSAGAAAASYAAALLCKEHAVVFAALLPCVDAFRARPGSARAALRARLGLYGLLGAVTVAWLMLRASVLSSGQPVFPLDNPLVLAGPGVRILTALKVQVLYLARLAAPLGLQATYTGSSVSLVESALSAWGAGSLAALGLAGALLAHGWRRRRGHGLGIALYAVSASVTANILFVAAILMAERFLYLPSSWFSLAVASLAFGREGGTGASRYSRAAAAAFAVWLLCLGGRAVARNMDYVSPVRLWGSAAARDPGNVRAWMALADALWEERRFDEADRAFRSAVAADPRFPDSSALYGLFLLERNRPAEAFQAGLRGGGGPLASVVLAEASLRMGNPREALARLEATRPVAGLRERYWLTKAGAHEALGERSEAAAALAMIGRGPARRTE